VWADSDDSVWAVGHGGTIVHWDGRVWSYSSRGTLDIFVDVWGSGPEDIWVVGVSGVILHGDGKQWSPATSGTKEHLAGVWGSGKDAVWVVGENGTILRWNGRHWAPSPSGTKAGLNDVWGTSRDSAWAAGEGGAIVRWDGRSWVTTPASCSQDFTGIWSGPNDDVWAVGTSVLAHRSGQTWSCEAADFDLVAISARLPTDVWSAGFKGIIRHWDGQRWSEAGGATHEALSALSVTPSGSIWAVGHEGVVLRHGPWGGVGYRLDRGKEEAFHMPLLGGSGMKNFVLAPLLALVIVAGGGRAIAADKNKCGCYKDGAGVCFCERKAKCGCPGDCEPKGCEEARDKQLQKEIEAETKKAAQADRSHTTSHGSEKSSGHDKTSGGEDRDEVSSKASPGSKSASATESASARTLTPAHAKQLVKLLDLYLADNPDARRRNVEDVRNELSRQR
jgi:hypothetical protein